MSPLKLWLIIPLVFAGPSLAQGTKQQGFTTQTQGTAGRVAGRVRTPVATQPSSNPFQNPIGQGVPPAVSANPNQNSIRTNTVPIR
jgi:hypothetical protein